ncbi:MAG: septal ring lytic transglycosylase RlpA family protein [Burkholderiaceae bacterium]|nr:septal ring lytic transglycosylase RlpA family protein [Burkholderiaceae bacterium]
MRRPRYLIVTALCLTMAIMAGCSSSGRSTRSSGGGGYYKDDGPGSNIPANIAAIPDAVPRLEDHRPANARPYVVFGKRYVPISEETTFRQQGTASWYGRKFHGNKTANGETYDMYAMTAAHPTLPLPSYARVTHAGTKKSVIVRINDRGPFHSARIIDLSYVAAAKLDLIGPGSGQVIVEAITSSDIRNNAWYQPGNTPKAQPLAPAAPPQPYAAPVLITQAPVPNALDAIQEVDGPPTYSSFADNTAAQPLGQTVMYQPSGANQRATDSGNQIFLQFGAFGAQQSADILVTQLNHDLQNVESRNAHVTTGGNLYRVQIGPYPSRTAAVNAALRIQQQTGLAGSIAVR